MVAETDFYWLLA